MAEDRTQKELFEFKKPKRVFPGIGRIFPRNKTVVALSMERLIFISIILIMIMVLLYAIGVEKGKRVGRNLSLAMPPLEKSVSPVVPKGPSAVPAPAKIEIAPGRQAGKPYTIVAATFSSQGAASTEMSRLKKEGFDAFLSESDSYFQVCIGAYSSRADAQPALKKVKQRHLDAYIKFR